MKKYRYVIIVLLLFIISMTILAAGGRVSNYIDPFSIVFVTAITVSLLLFAGGWSDYLRAYKIATGKLDYTTKELKARKIMVDFAIKIIFIAGIVGTIIGSIQIAIRVDSISVAKLQFTVAILTLLYAVIINMIHYALSSLIEKEIVYRGDE